MLVCYLSVGVQNHVIYAQDEGTQRNEMNGDRNQSKTENKLILDIDYDFNDYLNILKYWDNTLEELLASQQDESQEMISITKKYTLLHEEQKAILTRNDGTKSVRSEAQGEIKEIKSLINEYKDAIKYILRNNEERQLLFKSKSISSSVAVSNPPMYTVKFGDIIEIAEPVSEPDGKVIGYIYYMPPYFAGDVVVEEGIVRDGSLKLHLSTGPDGMFTEPGLWCLRFFDLGTVRNLEIRVTTDELLLNEAKTIQLVSDDSNYVSFKAPKTGEYFFYIEHNDYVRFSWITVTYFNSKNRVSPNGKIISDRTNTTFKVSLKGGEEYKIEIRCKTPADVKVVIKDHDAKFATYQYDEQNKLESIRYGDGYKVKYNYDNSGNLISRTVIEPK